MFGIALPVLSAGLSSGRDWNRVKLQALLTLMAHTEDSNILSRQNPAVLRAVQEEISEFLRCGGAYREDSIKLLEELDADYSRRGISAGGCADLLAAAHSGVDVRLPGWRGYLLKKTWGWAFTCRLTPFRSGRGGWAQNCQICKSYTTNHQDIVQQKPKYRS